MLLDSLQDQLLRLRALDEQIARIEQRILDWRRNDDACLCISEIPGVGVLRATAAVSVTGQARTFRSGREFAAYLGLVPRQNGSGGKIKLGGISKRGDAYLRTLLIHGARSVISSSKHLPERLHQMLSRDQRKSLLLHSQTRWREQFGRCWCIGAAPPETPDIASHLNERVPARRIISMCVALITLTA